MKTAGVSKNCEDPEPAGQSSVRQQQNQALEVPPALLDLKRIAILHEIDRQLLIVSDAAAALIDTQTSDAAPLRVHEVVVPSENGRWVSHEPRSGRGFRLGIVTGALLMALGLGWFGGSNFYRYFDKRDELTGGAAINAVVERIIGVNRTTTQPRRIAGLAQQDPVNS